MGSKKGGDANMLTLLSDMPLSAALLKQFQGGSHKVTLPHPDKVRQAHGGFGGSGNCSDLTTVDDLVFGKATSAYEMKWKLLSDNHTVLFPNWRTVLASACE